MTSDNPSRARSSVAVAWRIPVPGRSHDMHNQPCYGRAPVEPEVGKDEDLPGDQTVECHTGPASFTGRPFLRGDTRSFDGKCLPAPVVDAVREMSGQEAGSCGIQPSNPRRDRITNGRRRHAANKQRRTQKQAPF